MIRRRLCQLRRFAIVPTLALLSSALVASPSLATDLPLTLVTHNAAGTGSANDSSSRMSWDDAGRYAAFSSGATNLVAGSTGGERGQAYLYERLTGAVTLISHAIGSPLQGANGVATAIAISGDGAFVLFDSDSTNLVAGQVDPSGSGGLFLWSRVADTVQLVSHSTAGTATAANASASGGALSADGRWVVFASGATDLPGVAVKNNSCEDIYLFDRSNAQIILVSHQFATSATTTNGCSIEDSISDDGGFIGWETDGTDVVAAITDANGAPDVYLFTRATGSNRLVSRASATSTANQTSNRPQVCPDGTCLVFLSSASDVEGLTADSNGAFDAFLYDRLADALLLVSRRGASGTATGNGRVFAAIPSGDGSSVAFSSDGTNHTIGQVDTNGEKDLFHWRRNGAAGLVRVVSHLPGAPTTTGEGGVDEFHISLDGSRILYSSEATNLVAGQVDTNGDFDVFAWSRSSGENRLLSHTPAGVASSGDGRSFEPSLSRSSSLVAGFSSGASNLVANDTNGFSDLFFTILPLFEDGFESGDVASWTTAP